MSKSSVKAGPSKTVTVEPPQFWVSVKYLDGKESTEVKEAFNVKGFKPSYNEDFVKDKVYRVFWSNNKSETLKKVQASKTTIPNRRGTELAMGYYEAKIVKMDTNKAVLHNHLCERQARKDYASSTTSSDSVKSSSSGSSCSSSSSSHRKRPAHTSHLPEPNPPKLKDQKNSPEVNVFGFDLHDLNDKMFEEKNVDSLLKKLTDLKRKYNDLRTQSMTLKEENDALNSKVSMLTEINLENQLFQLKLKKNCNHVCACGLSANKQFVQQSTPSAMSPEHKAPQPKNSNSNHHQLTVETDEQQGIEVVTHMGEEFPDKEPGEIVQPLKVEMVIHQENIVTETEEENVTIYKEYKIPKSLYDKLKHIVGKDYGFGKKHDTSIVNDCCDALWTFEYQGTHTVTGTECRANLKKMGADGKPPVGEQLPVQEVDAIAAVLQSKVKKQQDTKPEDLSEGETHGTVKEYAERLKRSTATRHIGQKVHRAFKHLRKASLKTEPKEEAQDETES